MRSPLVSRVGTDRYTVETWPMWNMDTAAER